MKLEDQVCSLELAKRLKDLGIPQESLFKHYYNDKKCWWSIMYGSGISIPERYSAFTGGELGKILPNIITIPDQEPFDNYRIQITKFNTVEIPFTIMNNYRIGYVCDSTEVKGVNAWLFREPFKAMYDSNLATAMAEMLIYLIENGLYEVKK